MTHHLPRAPPLNPITLGYRISTQGFVRDRNDQTILFSLVQEGSAKLVEMHEMQKGSLEGLEGSQTALHHRDFGILQII